MDCCNNKINKRKVGLVVVLVAAATCVVGAVKCPWMQKQMSAVSNKVQQLNPLK